MFQLGAVISQKGKYIALYSRKLTDSQQNYIVIERELLSIVETLKEIRTILLGQKLIIYTDHKNPTCDNFNTGRVLRLRPILEEYWKYIEYIKYEKNIVADALSRLPLNGNQETTQKSVYQQELVSEINDIEEIPEGTFPINFKFTQQNKRAEPSLIYKYKYGTYHKGYFCRGSNDNITLITCKDKIVIP